MLHALIGLITAFYSIWSQVLFYSLALLQLFIHNAVKCFSIQWPCYGFLFAMQSSAFVFSGLVTAFYSQCSQVLLYSVALLQFFIHNAVECFCIHWPCYSFLFAMQSSAFVFSSLVTAFCSQCSRVFLY